MAFVGWGRKCSLTIQSGQVTNNEVNFPLLVTEDTLPSEIFDADGSYPALNGGGDIRFSSDSDGNTQLACEIEKFVTNNDPANGKAAIWVKVPSLSSSSNTTIYIWYNKAGESQPAEDNAYGKENVWDANFKMVQHMNQTPDGTAGEIVDSTSNNNDGTTSGMDSADQVAGQIDGSLDFDGVDDYVDLPLANTMLSNLNVYIISAWVYVGDVTNKQVIWADISFNGFGDSAGVFEFDIDDTNLYFQASYNVADAISFSHSDVIGWYHIVGVKNGTSDAEFFVNGESKGTDTALKSGTNGGSHKIGRPLDDVRYFNGIIDEVRISNTARTAGWIATEYNNQYSPSSFYTVGSEEEEPADEAKGLVNDTIGATPFYTNQSNPRNISLSQDESQLVTFWVNATGEIDTTHVFFAYINLTSNMSISNITNEWNVTIVEAEAEDTCTYTTGNWNVDCNDNCLISSNVNLGGNNLTLSGTGVFNVQANISNFGYIFKPNGCQINIFNSGGLSK